MNKTALVTGGCRGIGSAVVKRLCRDGFNVALNYNSSEDKAKSLSSELSSLGYNVFAVQCDVSSGGSVKKMFETVRKELGEVDLLVNNAGIAQQKLFTDITDSDWDKMIGVDLSGTFYTCREALPYMIRQKSGKIINVSSMWGQVGASCEVHYSAAKAGVIGMGATGTMIAAGLQRFGADVRYFSRTRKPALEEAHGYRWMELPELLADCDAIFTCLTKNVILMKDEQFAQFGDGKIFFNTSIAPSFETEALERWLARGGNELFCDMPSALGEHAERLLANPHVNCVGQSAGFTGQAAVRLSEKSLNNIRAFLENN